MATIADSRPIAASRIAQEIERELERLESELVQARDTPDPDVLSHQESGVLITAGALGILGSGQAAAWTLQNTLDAKYLEDSDFALAIPLAVQRGLAALGPWGGTAAVVLGWLMLFGLIALQVAGHTTKEGKPRHGPGWPAWALSLGLVVLPFYDLQETRPSVSVLLGVAVSCGLYAVVPVLQRSEAMRRFFNWLDHGGVGAFVALTTLALLLAGLLVPYPSAALTGLLLFSCLSFKTLLVGLQRRAKVQEISGLVARMDELRAQLAREERQRWVEEELKLFREKGGRIGD